MSDKDQIVKTLKEISETVKTAAQWCQSFTSENKDHKDKLIGIANKLDSIAIEIEKL